MLSALVDLSIRFRGVVIALACLTLGYGLWVAAHAKIDIYPEFAPPLVEIQTEAPGLSPEQVETLVTRPIEAAVNGVAGLASLRSQSIQGLSVITSTFKDEIEIYRARQQVAERLVEAAGQLPQGIGAPIMSPLTSSTGDLLLLGLVSATRTSMELRDFARWTIRPRILGVPGVAKVSIMGGDFRQLQIQVRPERLAAFGLSLEDVVQAAKKATGVRGAGFIETEAQRVVIRTEGQALDPDALGNVVVAHKDGASVRLCDVAHVVEAPRPRFGDAAANGVRGVLLQVNGQFGANTSEVTEAVEHALDELRPAMERESITYVPSLFRPASFVADGIRNVNHSLLIGGLLVGSILFFFLYNVRTAFISLTAIPLSLLVAVIVLERLGMTINVLTLGGLAIAIGEVVDDAIIDVENIFRRLRENGKDGRPALSPLRIVYEASIEVRSSVVYATLVVVLVFLPVLTMTGVQGKLFAPLGFAYILAILASLVVALTLTPALSAVLLARHATGAHEPPIVGGLKARYRGLLEGLTAYPKTLVIVAALLCAGGIASMTRFTTDFLPDFQEHHYTLHMSLVPGTSVDVSMRVGKSLAEELLRNPHIKSVSQFAGRAEQGDDTWGPHYSEMELQIDPALEGADAVAAKREILEITTHYPGCAFELNTFIKERMSEVLTGSTADVVVKIFGDDLESLDSAASQVQEAMKAVHGGEAARVTAPPGQPELVVQLRPERLKQFGFAPTDVLDSIQTAYEGEVVAQSYEASRVLDVNVILEPLARREPESVGGLLLRSAQGLRVPLRELADVHLGTGRYTIEHDQTRRRQSVQCNVAGRDVGSFVDDAKRAIGALKLPAGTYVTFEGAAEQAAAARRELALHSTLAGVGILLLLAVVFNNLRNLLLVLANLPMALVGGVLAVYVTGGSVSVGSLVGFVTLFGITTRNSIMMISHYEHLVGVEAHPWNLETALRGASERLAPVLMTAIVTALGLLPIALGSGAPGREIEGPMAVVILGGLATSTVLNLLVLPTLALRFGRFEKPVEEMGVN